MACPALRSVRMGPPQLVGAERRAGDDFEEYAMKNLRKTAWMNPSSSTIFTAPDRNFPDEPEMVGFGWFWGFVISYFKV